MTHEETTMPYEDRTGTEPVLRARELTRTFGTSTSPAPVLDGIDLAVDPGEYLAVMGPSGSGKSTLLYCLSGLDRPSGGSVTFEGSALTALTDAETAHVRLARMGFVFQQAHFLENLNIRDNILLPALKATGRRSRRRREGSGAGGPGARRAAVTRVDALLERFGIAHVGHHGVTEVSGGQLQRASLCRALATRPSILFADEPTGALDSSMGAEVTAALTEVHREGTTLAMVTHSPGLAARAGRVVYLRDGRVLDSLVLGNWTEDEAARREAELQDWLREKGY